LTETTLPDALTTHGDHAGEAIATARHLIGADWRDATGQRLTVLDPATGEPASQVPVADADTVDAAVRAARDAFVDWREVPAGARGAALHEAANRLEAATERIARTVSTELGRALAENREGVAAAVSTLRQYAELGPVHRGRTLLGGASTADLMVPCPRGVTALVTPWNDPVAVTAGLLGAAVVTGNTVVVKPSERTPVAVARMVEAIAPAFPAGVVNLVLGGPETGAHLVSRPGLALIAHVGSTRTGRSIAAAAASTGAKVLLENGGCDPLLVDEDVDPEWAAEQAAVGAFSNAGQLCVAVERIYVHERIAPAFVDALTVRAEKWQIGPLVDRRHRDSVHRQVAEALDRGARLRAGGQVPEGPGAFYPCTVLTDCTDDMTVMREETFGPVAPVRVVDGWDEGLAAACDSAYGLAATVLTGDFTRMQSAWHALDVGTVKVNNVFGGAPGGAAQPRRGSGQGFGYGPELLDEMTTTKVVHLAPAVRPAGSPRKGTGQ
jgi:succinate-semialdehyde dehydrogenase/glutarate-semialdehyde dehydrogenase